MADDVDWSKYCVVRIEEYDNLRKEIKQLRHELQRMTINRDVAVALYNNQVWHNPDIQGGAKLNQTRETQ